MIANRTQKCFILAAVLLVVGLPPPLFGGDDAGDTAIHWVEQHIYRLSKEKAQEEIRHKVSTIELYIIAEIFHHTESALTEFNKVTLSLEEISGYSLKPEELYTLDEDKLRDISNILIQQISHLLNLRTQLSLATYQMQLLVNSTDSVMKYLDRLQNREFLSTLFVHQKIPNELNPDDLLAGVYVSVPVSSIVSVLQGEASAAPALLGIPAPVLDILVMAYEIGSSLYNVYKNHKAKKKLKKAQHLWMALQMNQDEFWDLVSFEIQKKINPIRDLFLKSTQNSQGYLTQLQRFYDIINRHLRTTLFQLQAIQTQLPKRNLLREINTIREKRVQRERYTFFAHYRQDLRRTVTLYALGLQEIKLNPTNSQITLQTLQLEARFNSLVNSRNWQSRLFHFTDEQMQAITRDIDSHKAFLKELQPREK